MPRSPCLEHAVSTPRSPVGWGEPRAPAPTAPLSPQPAQGALHGAAGDLLQVGQLAPRERPQVSVPPACARAVGGLCSHEHCGHQGSVCLFSWIAIPVPSPVPVCCTCRASAVPSTPRAPAGPCPRDPQTHCCLWASKQPRARTLPPWVGVMARLPSILEWLPAAQSSLCASRPRAPCPSLCCAVGDCGWWLVYLCP